MRTQADEEGTVKKNAPPVLEAELEMKAFDEELERELQQARGKCRLDEAGQVNSSVYLATCYVVRCIAHRWTICRRNRWSSAR